MALAAGTRVGPYEVTALIGRGGMGDVYRAHDRRLHRDVALKVLPDVFAGDPQRLARFQREAQLVASLNHANIGGIYGLEDADGSPALVLELIEGPTLPDRIVRGPMPLDEALPAARDRRCARSRAWAGDRPPRPEAIEHQGTAGRDGQASGFRTGEGARRHPCVASEDGQRFLVNMLVEEASAIPITLVINWPELLKN